jgi:hypothetical protein
MKKGEETFSAADDGKVYRNGGFGPLSVSAWNWYFPWPPPHKRTIIDHWK